jgi:NTE family protein
MIVGLGSALKWLFWRLPRPFSATFLLISVLWAVFGFHYLHRFADHVRKILDLPSASEGGLPSDFVGLAYAAVSLLSFIIGFLVAYDLSALVNKLHFRLLPKPIKYPLGFVPIPFEKHAARVPFSKSTRIGIVLAGGGAKGAYQAGAMKAIYEFLDSRSALGNVKVISGTSVGSWNAMFWLANMIKSPKGWTQPGCLEWWWKRLTARDLIAPRFFLPSFNNAFLSTEPWQRQFDQIFGSDDVKKTLFATDIHFYLTRSNVRSGCLECATNNPAPPVVNRVRYDFVGKLNSEDEYLARLKMGVFASMDLPPLFPYTKCNEDLFEDGGVIDNLPLSFAAVDNCDLIFVLPLNSDFEQEPNDKSMVARISRIMDVQQGALERNGFKLLYLYNEVAALRNRIQELESDKRTAEIAADTEGQTNSHQRPLKRAMQRTNQEIKIFAVCPDKAFVRTTVNTRDLWNTRGSHIAFDVMYSATADMLSTFDFAEPQRGSHVAMIRRSGTYYLDHDF